MFFQKHWTFSKILRDVFFKTTVSFFSGFYPIFYTKKGCIKTFFLTQPFRYYFAEKQGFEPWEQLPVHRISSAARSTTPASFLKPSAKLRLFSEKHHFYPIFFNRNYAKICQIT